MEELLKRAEKLRGNINQAWKKLRIDELSKELAALHEQIADPNLWQDRNNAEELTKREAALMRRIQPWKAIKQETDDVVELIKLNDSSMRSELESKLTSLADQLSSLQSELKFQGPYDDHNVIINIYAGAGGTDAQDWAQMLERMYLRWAEQEDVKSKVIEESAGDEAGIKSTTIELVGGDFLYGKLAGEHGVHRLVRLSPFNADHKRQTSFAKVDVLPLIDKPSELELDDKELKVDVFRAGGHGGQSVNTTDSAVRITHMPTGITVSIQNERSQLQNKETAMNILRSKLVQLQLDQHAKNLKDLKGPDTKNEWGSQIRSYVLHPYKQVKDLRTGYISSDPDKILNGNLAGFITAWLDKTE